MYNDYNYGLNEVLAVDCMKCGKELKSEGVFCPACLAEMEKYPVKPNITVQLPVRKANSNPRRRPRRQRYVKAEDQIRHLKKVRNGLIVTLLTVILIFTAAISILVHYFDLDEEFDIGQNYNTSENT